MNTLSAAAALVLCAAIVGRCVTVLYQAVPGKHKHPILFLGFGYSYVVLGAGAIAGALGLVLERLADDLEERQALQAKLMGAALYPAIVSVVALCIVLFLLGYVVPQVAEVFAGSKRALPTLTVIMLALGSFVRNQGWIMLIAMFFIATSACKSSASSQFGLKP